MPTDCFGIDDNPVMIDSLAGELARLSSFIAVADNASFTTAADQLGVAKARLSLDVRRLEAALGTALFTRTTRRVTLTDAGRRLHAAAAPLLGSLHEALAQAGQDSAELSGRLRIAASVDHAAQSVAAAVAGFGALHPRLQIELLASDRVGDMVADGIDLAFRLGWLRDSTHRATRIGDFAQIVVTAPAYLARRGRPQRPADLAAHDWVALNLLPAPLTWTFSAADGAVENVRVHARLATDAPGALRAMLMAGAGVSVLSELTVRADLQAGRLVQVLEGWALPGGGIHAVYPPGRHLRAGARAFVDYYRSGLTAPG
jgi:DNA-binding transcriptional LysR family regulator